MVRRQGGKRIRERCGKGELEKLEVSSHMSLCACLHMFVRMPLCLCECHCVCVSVIVFVCVSWRL